jgi:hypothetical protein
MIGSRETVPITPARTREFFWFSCFRYSGRLRLGRKGRKMRLYMALVALACTGLFAPAEAQVCTPDQRSVNYAKADVVIYSFLCRVSADAPPLFRLTFHRLSEKLAGSIINQTPLPEIDNFIGSYDVYKNDTYKELRALFSQFGTTQTYGIDENQATYYWAMSINGSTLEKKQFNVLQEGDRSEPLRTVWYLSESYAAFPRVFLKSAAATILNTTQWPSDFNFFYKCYDEATEFVSCTILWKYISLVDFDSILQDVREAERRLERKVKKARAPGLTKIEPIYERNFRMFRYLAKPTAGLPFDFLPVRVDLDDGTCDGDMWMLTYYPKALSVDVAVVENLSSEPLKIDDLLGLRSESSKVRASTETMTSRADTPTTLGQEAALLQPGRQVVVPLAIIFEGGPEPVREQPDTPTTPQPAPVTSNTQADDDTINDILIPNQVSWPKLTEAEAAYQKIIASKSRVLSEKLYGKTVRKVRESFKPPTAPKASSYLYGPEIALSGLIANGQKFSLGSSAKVGPSRTNNLNLQIQIDDNTSCPILYVWSETERLWINLGKVIEKANGPDKLMTQSISLASLSTRFRLEEAEPEVSYIEKIQLVLALRDGRRVEVPPSSRFDGVIPGYSSQDISFELPAGVVADAVIKSEIQITGYYRRYSSILSEVPGLLD